MKKKLILQIVLDTVSNHQWITLLLEHSSFQSGMLSSLSSSSYHVYAFHRNDQTAKLDVTEVMGEGRFSFCIPIQLMLVSKANKI